MKEIIKLRRRKLNLRIRNENCEHLIKIAGSKERSSNAVFRDTFEWYSEVVGYI
jgi:hypothetical protein